MKTLTFLGDSITAGFGLPSSHSYPSLFARAVKIANLPLKVINAGVSGDTTAGGLRRLHHHLRDSPAYLVVALGANDMLRGLAVSEVKENLTQVINESRLSGTQPILFGMQSVPFHGFKYMFEFNQMFPDLAAKFRIPYLPFFIKNVVLRANLNQADRMHPNADGQKLIAKSVIQFLFPILKKQLRHPGPLFSPLGQG